MKMTTLKKVIPAALMLAGAAGLSSTANASVYAVAYNNIFDLLVISDPFVPVGDFYAFSATSAAAANLNGSGVSGSDAGVGGPADSPVAIGTGSAFAGGNPVNNAMTAEGQAGNYSYADSQISQTSLLDNDGVISVTGDLTQAWGIAEGFIASSGNADATTRNSSETGFDSTISLNQDTVFTFSFNAAPYLFVEMSADAIGTSTNAFLTVTITITDGAGNTVFAWSPDGEAGGISGGTEVFDPFDLQADKERTSAGTAIYDPTGAGAPNGTINPGSFGFFQATTGVLTAGIYTISLDMTENTNLSTRGTRVPEPGVLALVGLGLAGLGIGRRRKARRS